MVTLSVIFIQAQLLCNLSVGEIQPHEIQAQYPSPQRLMMAGQRRVREIVETKLAIVAKIALAMRAITHPHFLGVGLAASCQGVEDCLKGVCAL